MKKVVKVSIAHFAFTLEEEAFRKVDTYLNDLKTHYAGNENSAEIIDGIEERMAELLIERCPDGRVVSPDVVDNVINILGRPDVIGEESGERSKERYSSRNEVKRLYRDPDNKILGGICSGIAAYYNTDPTPIRLLFVLLFIVLSLVPFRVVGGAFVIIAYIILWIIIPRAKTVEQRFEMRGQKPTVSNIEKNIEEGISTLGSRMEDIGRETSGFWKMLGRIFSIAIGLILVLTGISGIIVSVVLFTGAQVFNADINDFLFFFINMSSSTTVLFKIVSAMAIILPFIGMLYGGINLLFKFKSPKWHPGVIIFILWILSLCSAITIGVISSSPYWDNQSQSKVENLESVSDTLYIKLNDLGSWKDGPSAINATSSSYELIYIDYENGSDHQVVAYPRIVLKRNSGNQEEQSKDMEIRSRTTIFPDVVSFEEMKNAMDLSFYSFSGDTLYVDPVIYNKHNKVKEVSRELYISVPEGKTVIVEDPIYHQFQSRFRYNNLKKFFRWID